MGLTKNRSSEKLRKKTNRANIIVTNFVWEQLKFDMVMAMNQQLGEKV